MRRKATVISFAALIFVCESCSSSGADAASEPPPRACSPAASVGEHAADCAAYCAVFNDCVGCGGAVEASCNELCQSSTSSAECLACAVDHIGEIVGHLSCSNYPTDAGTFSLTYSSTACGQACAL